MLKRYTPRQAARTLAKYDTVSIEVALGEGVSLTMVQARDAYALLDRLIEREEAGASRVTRFPYWAEIWPAAMGLSRWFIDRAPEALTVRIRELGCGLGLVGVALARAAWHVESTDFVEDALILAAHNARVNRVPDHQHQVAYLDWGHPVGAPVECMVASDVAYDRALHPLLLRTFRQLLLPRGRLYLSDPRRPAARPLFDALDDLGYEHTTESVEVTWQSLAHHIDVHILRKPA